MDFLNNVVLIAALLLFGSIMASAISSHVGAPLLLVFLILGMIAGTEGLGNVAFQDIRLSYVIGTVALAIILLDGGLRTRAEAFRVGLRPALSLATLGVVVTSGIVGLFAAWLLDLHWAQGLLLGAIVGSTDAAAVFSLLHARGMNLEQRVGATLEIESGSNDPMAIFLTITLIAVLATEQSLFGWKTGSSFLLQLGVGALAGYLGGRFLALLVNSLNLASGLYPLLVTTGGLLIYALANSLGGSGFLAIYLVGVVLGNSRLRAGQNILRVHDGLAWLSQISMFLILGLLVNVRDLLPLAPAALLVALVLIFVARPIAVVLSLAPFRFAWREQTYIAWVGLRGAVPIILALFPLLAGLENADVFFNVAFFVVLVSLLLQGWTVAPMARLLKLEVPPSPEPLLRIDTSIPGHPDCDILVYQLTPGSPLNNRAPHQILFPGSARLTTVIRNRYILNPPDVEKLQAGDYLHILVATEDVEALNRLFTTIEYTKEHQFFGDFVLDAGASLADLAGLYGVEAPATISQGSIGDYMMSQFHNKPVVGDRVRYVGLELVVIEIEQDRISKVGLKLPKEK